MPSIAWLRIQPMIGMRVPEYHQRVVNVAHDAGELELEDRVEGKDDAVPIDRVILAGHGLFLYSERTTRADRRERRQGREGALAHTSRRGTVGRRQRPAETMGPGAVGDRGGDDDSSTAQ